MQDNGINAIMINNNISMSIKVPKVTRLFRFCDFSNVVAFGHNELWRIINASTNRNNSSISAFMEIVPARWNKYTSLTTLHD